jgi:hypothetical protein
VGIQTTPWEEGGLPAAKGSVVGDHKISVSDLPEAERSAPEMGEIEHGAPYSPGLLRRATPLLRTAGSIAAVTGLVIVAAAELRVPAQEPVNVPTQTVKTTHDAGPSEVAEVPSAPVQRRTVRVRSSLDRRPRSKSGGARHVTLSFGAPRSSEKGSFSPQRDDGAESAQPTRRKKKRPQKTETIEVSFAQPKAELIHIHKIGTGEHFYSTDRQECEKRYEEDYIYRGVVGLVFNEQVEGTVPLRTDDGIAAYIWSDPGEDRLPLHYFRGPGKDEPRDYYTANETDREDYVARGWNYYGIVGYVTAR